MWEDRALLPVVRWLADTLRVTVEGPKPDPSRPHVYAFHHGRQLSLLRYPRERDVVVLTSLSRDGEIQARVLSGLGFRVARGSSSRGGAEGLAAVVRAVRGGASAALAVDGPRGPAGAVKPGALFVARAARALVVPITSAGERTARLERAWDRFVVPAPWSRVVILRGEPFEVSREEDGRGLELATERLARALDAIAAEADALVSRQGRGGRLAA